MRGGDANKRGGARKQVRKHDDIPMLISERACKRMIGHNELHTSNWQRYTGTLAYKAMIERYPKRATTVLLASDGRRLKKKSTRAKESQRTRDEMRRKVNAQKTDRRESQ